MRARNSAYWKQNYVVFGDADQIEGRLSRTQFAVGDRTDELLLFEWDRDAPNILISPGSGGHAYVFAELAHEMH